MKNGEVCTDFPPEAVVVEKPVAHQPTPFAKVGA